MSIGYDDDISDLSQQAEEVGPPIERLKLKILIQICWVLNSIYLELINQ